MDGEILMDVEAVVEVVAWCVKNLGGPAVVGGLIAKFVTDRILEGSRQHFESQLTTLRSRLENTQFSYRVQFETEFKSMGDVWGLVAEVRDKMSAVRPIADIVPENETAEQQEERFFARRREFLDSLNRLITQTYKIEPFMPQAIFDCLTSLLKVAKLEAIDVRTTRPGEDRWYERGEEHLRQYCDLADELSKLMRQYFAQLRVVA